MVSKAILTCAGRPFVYAHRGASVAHPENTVEAFMAAKALGADGVELDVRLAADGSMVVHHDARLADGRLICDLERSQLPESIPTLAEALDACTGLVVNVEIKNHPDDADYDPAETVARQLVELLEHRSAAGVGDSILASSFNPATLQAVRQQAPELPTGQLLGHVADLPATIEAATAAGHVALHLWNPMVDAAAVAAAHRAGLLVNVWTVDEPARLVELASLGVDGVFTNVPDAALEVLVGPSGGNSR